MVSLAEAMRRGWLTDDGAIDGSWPVNGRPGEKEREPANAQDWRSLVCVSQSRDERQIEREETPHVEDKRGIPADTLRRLRYPVIETIHADGSRTFKHDPQIRDDVLIAPGNPTRAARDPSSAAA
jgi:hypothetical protein